MKGRVEIRPAGIDDLRDIFVLGLEIFGNEASQCLPEWNETNLAEALARDPGFSVVAVTKKSITGFLIASPEEIRGVQTVAIRWLCADRTAAGGIMADMLNVFKSTLSERNIEKIVVTLPETNSELIEYYRNFGFTDSKRFIIMENFLPKKP